MVSGREGGRGTGHAAGGEVISRYVSLLPEVDAEAISQDLHSGNSLGGGGGANQIAVVMWSWIGPAEDYYDQTTASFERLPTSCHVMSEITGYHISKRWNPENG